MKPATLKLTTDSRFVFQAEDFYLEFTVAPVLKSIDKVLEVDGGFFALLANIGEKHIYLPDLTKKIKLEWNFSKYETEVLL